MNILKQKIEEIYVLVLVNELVCISDRTYTHEQVLVMEKRILGELESYLTVPTPSMFLVRFIKASLTDSDVENTVYFLAELGMMNYTTLMYCPSMIAASAVYAAGCTLNKAPHWNETLKMHTAKSLLAAAVVEGEVVEQVKDPEEEAWTGANPLLVYQRRKKD
ncbi:hypothetical protein BUALT_Bualt16G0117800 [Buddleja alternifolia]|uniref:Uncharacterized protein n=1 Tax=Buddleja alternifolia TaxID=168488 RepID=A0AAV6WHH8_9LAMI|nr:hypothetical protein BUALT_Bualt16G0117800 [Buddleja alternifolia]